MSYFPPNQKEYNYLRHLVLLAFNNEKLLTEEQLLHYVVHLNDKNEPDDWLYDSFLFVPITATSGNNYLPDVNAGTTRSGEGDFFAIPVPNPTNKNDWNSALDSYFDQQYNLKALDLLIEKMSNELGKPYPHKHNIVLSLPYPGIRQTLFGVVEPGGKKLNFSIQGQNLDKATRDRLTAEKWFIDEVLKRWDSANYKNLNLLGFYWIFETVYRSWEIDDHWLLKELLKYIHEKDKKFLWIPFYCAYNVHLLDNYQDYYFDCAMLQPNYMFYKNITNVGKAAEEAKQRNAGFEMEYAFYDYSYLGALKQNSQDRYRDYLNGGVEYGYMTESVCGWFYAGHMLAKMRAHQDAKERELYDDIYYFIKGDYKVK